METDRLKYFCAIVELGSLTKASEVLGISHSGLSKAISVLQSEVDMDLLRPQGRGLEVTSEGKEFYKKSVEILKLIDGLQDSAIETSDAPVKIALSEALGVSLSGQISEAMKTPAEIHLADVGEVEALLLSGKIDFAIISVITPHPEIEYLKIGKVRFHSAAKKELYKMHKGNVPYVAPLTDFPLNMMGFKVRDGWPLKLKRNIMYRVKNHALALDLLRSGQAAAFVPEYLVKSESLSIVKEHKAAQTDREFYLVKLKSSEESKAMKAASKVIRKICVK